MLKHQFVKSNQICATSDLNSTPDSRKFTHQQAACHHPPHSDLFWLLGHTHLNTSHEIFQTHRNMLSSLSAASTLLKRNQDQNLYSFANVTKTKKKKWHGYNAKSRFETIKIAVKVLFFFVPKQAPEHETTEGLAREEGGLKYDELAY